ncbi:MAG: hypothetical protein M1829_005597 [Trizodia sp. TS-e1964]|nr:MAG: hypothetical protein M1829_005597 [Trizodia sp. TS-e1964]
MAVACLPSSTAASPVPSSSAFSSLSNHDRHHFRPFVFAQHSPLPPIPTTTAFGPLLSDQHGGWASRAEASLPPSPASISPARNGLSADDSQDVIICYSPTSSPRLRQERTVPYKESPLQLEKPWRAASDMGGSRATLTPSPLLDKALPLIKPEALLEVESSPPSPVRAEIGRRPRKNSAIPNLILPANEPSTPSARAAIRARSLSPVHQSRADNASLSSSSPSPTNHSPDKTRYISSPLALHARSLSPNSRVGNVLKSPIKSPIKSPSLSALAEASSIALTVTLPKTTAEFGPLLSSSPPKLQPESPTPSATKDALLAPNPDNPEILQIAQDSPSKPDQATTRKAPNRKLASPMKWAAGRRNENVVSRKKSISKKSKKEKNKGLASAQKKATALLSRRIFQSRPEVQEIIDFTTKERLAPPFKDAKIVPQRPPPPPENPPEAPDKAPARSKSVRQASAAISAELASAVDEKDAVLSISPKIRVGEPFALPPIREAFAESRKSRSSRRGSSRRQGLERTTSKSVAPTQIMLHSPRVLHGPIRLSVPSREMSMRKAAIDTPDWTAFQIAISGPTGDYLMGGDEDSSESSDSIVDWFGSWGFESEGHLVHSDEEDDDPVGLVPDCGSPDSSISWVSTLRSGEDKEAVIHDFTPRMSCNLVHDLGDYLSFETYYGASDLSTTTP